MMDNLRNVNRNVLEFMIIGKVRIDIYEFLGSFEVIARIEKCGYIARGEDKWDTIEKALTNISRIYRELEEQS